MSLRVSAPSPVEPKQLHRTAFETSRLLEFFTEKELAMQLEVGRAQWPIALLKELIDNALDACEAAQVAPEITVTLAPDALTVADNGPGLPHVVLERSLDYLVRISDKAYYVSPTRGQLGNALKGLWAAPYVITRTEGRIEVATEAYACTIEVRLDRLAQRPVLTVTPRAEGFVKTGTTITMHWPGIAEGEIARAAWGDFYNCPRLLTHYAALNPHATFALCQADRAPAVWAASDPRWRKLPTFPTSPHWYTLPQFCDLLAAYLSADRQAGRPRTVREVVGEFQGLTGTGAQKEIASVTGLGRATLEDLVHDDVIDTQTAQALLRAMQQRSRVVKPDALGILGASHLSTALVQNLGASAQTVTYKKRLGTCDGLPYVLECACGWPEEDERPIDPVVGMNWTPALREPFPDWADVLDRCRVDSYDPVRLIVHLACPRVEVTNRAKSAVTLPEEIAEALTDGMLAVTKRWRGMKQQADKHNRVERKTIAEEAKRQRAQQITIKEAAWQVMEAAYLKASGRIGMANARQIMYAARPMVIALRGNDKIWSHDSPAIG
jgi:DNA topoisomerase VI subunit B